MAKSLFEDELVAGMERQFRKQASGEKPDLAKAVNCLHAALEILEEQGLASKAGPLLQVIQKFAQTNDAREGMQVQHNMPSLHSIMQAGMRQKDLLEFNKGNPIATARFNTALRTLGYSDHQISRYLGPNKLMSEEECKQLLNPNRAFSKIQDWLQDPTKPVDPNNPQPGETFEIKSLPITMPGDTISFKSIASKKPSKKGLTSEKMLKNLETHGHPLNLADDGTLDVPPPLDMNNLKESDFEEGFGEFADLLSSDSDDFLSVDINDTLEVSENDVPIDDFEDERD